jgi:hypothetical protein
MKLLLLCFGILIGFQSLAQKQNLVERMYEGASPNKNPTQAKREIQDEATEKGSEALIKEIIGEAKFSRNKSLIQSKILRNSARFIPFSRPGELKPEGEGFKMTVALKYNLDDLQALLLENGLFYESDGTPTVIPMIHWNDKIRSQTWSWWKDGEDASKGFLHKENAYLENFLRQAFLKNQFYSMKPSAFKFSQILMPAFQVERLSTEDLQILSKKLGAQILVDGEVSFAKSLERSEAAVITLRLAATQIQNGRAIAEVSRQVETEMGPLEAVLDRKLKDLLEQASQDLATQVFDAWSRGTIGSSLYKLSLKGRLPLSLQEAFKETFKSKLHEVKNIRERLVSTEGLVFELDSLTGPREIAKKLPDFSLTPFKVVLDFSNDNEIGYHLEKEK